jgi:hypothetical protein
MEKFDAFAVDLRRSISGTVTPKRPVGQIEMIEFTEYEPNPYTAV